ncbi:acyltransferase domain-containing protein [Actinosynnema sp. NPDC059797]
MPSRTAVVFPGQGAHLAGSLSKLAPDYPVIGERLASIDEVARRYRVRPSSELLLDPGSPGIDELVDDPDAQNLVIFATSVCLYEVLRAEGLVFDVLVGHSGGEIAALTAAGCLSVADGARVSCERSAALRRAGLPRAGMLAVEAGPRRAACLVGAVDDWSLAVAVHNASEQTVISGLADGLEQVEVVAQALGLRATRLATPHPYHNPLLARAADEFSAALEGIELRLPRQRVYSPILGGYVEDDEAVWRLLSRHFILPVRFAEALTRLYGDGVRTFVEGGARQAMTGLAAQVLPASVRLITPLAHRVDRVALRRILTATADEAGPADATANATAPAVADALAPPVAATVPPEPVEEGPSLPSRETLLVELRQVFAESLGYPVEVFTDDAEFESDLGISSVKQTDIFVKVLRRYELPNPPVALRIRRYSTVPKLADLLVRLASGEPVEPDREA